jgi:5'-nucleotidase
MKKVIYLDMDGVVADFDPRLRQFNPEMGSLNKEDHQKLVDKTYEENPRIFSQLEPVKGAVESVKDLLKMPEADLYFVSATIWDVPEGYTDKRLWLEKHFGSAVSKRLIITQRKDLRRGDFLVEDRTRQGADEFEGEHIQFGNREFPNWTVTLLYLKNIIQGGLNENEILSLISIRTRKSNNRKKQ